MGLSNLSERGLFFYPYSGLNKERLNAIKQTLLYYDEVCFLQASEQTHSLPFMKLMKAEGDVQVLLDEGLLKWIEPTEIIEKSEPDIYEETIKDIELFRLLETDIGGEPYSWDMWELKIAERLRDGLQIGEGSGEGYFTLPFSQGEAILLNHAFFACDLYNLVPFTDDPLHHKLFTAKMENRVSELSRSKEVKSVVEKLHLGRGWDAFGRSVFKAIVPVWKAPQTIGIQDLLEFRDTTKDNRERFRVELARLYQEISEMDEKPNIEELVEEKLMPQIYRLQHEMTQLKTPRPFEIRRTAWKALAFAIPILGTILKWRELYKEAEEGRKYDRIRKNSLFYLIEIKERFPYDGRR